MKALKIKYLPATNHKPSRFKICDGDGNQLTEPLDYGLSDDEQAKNLAQKFLKKMNWDCDISGIGGFKDEKFITIK